MDRPNAKRVASRYLGVDKTAARTKTAGEVRFIKDRSGDKSEWGWGPPGPAEREINDDFVFNARYLKPLAQALRASLMALGHATSAQNTFVKLKSSNVSPDGSLGGKGYIAKISDMRRQYMNVVEALSALSDTLYDELHAPHWNPSEDELTPRDREEVQEIVEDAEKIRQDPEGWAEEEEEEMDEENEVGKQARSKTAGPLSYRGPVGGFDHLAALIKSWFGKNPDVHRKINIDAGLTSAIITVPPEAQFDMEMLLKANKFAPTRKGPNKFQVALTDAEGPRTRYADRRPSRRTR